MNITTKRYVRLIMDLNDIYFPKIVHMVRALVNFGAV